LIAQIKDHHLDKIYNQEAVESGKFSHEQVIRIQKALERFQEKCS
jgi:hypothetical protein